MLCQWQPDEEGSWHTSCAQIFLLEGAPCQNSMRYCCYCGGELIEMDAENPELEEVLG